MTRLKLKPLIEGINADYKGDFLRSVSEYNRFGKSVYREDSLVDVAKSLSQLAEKAEYYTLQEGGEWFDSVTIKRNMKELRDYAKQFGKCSGEAQALQERISTLYEDMGTILSRYYSLDELNELDEQDQALTEAVGGFNPTAVQQLVNSDKFLGITFKRLSGQSDQKLKTIYTSYITKDDELLSAYKKLLKTSK